MKLQIILQIAAGMQISVAVLNLFLVRLLKFQPELDRVSLLLREVFHVHAWFISVTLFTFGLLTWRFAAEMADGGVEVCRWLAGCIGLFWALRSVLQVAYYSASHWRGRLDRTVIHVVLLLIYGGFAGAYLDAAFG
jgi:hypothetical protein